LLAVFGARGLGVFPVCRLGAGGVGFMRGLRLLGRATDLKEEIHAILTRRGQHHPLVQRLMAAARG
jgi:LysR family transcriptional activator of nhaA